jgi:dolichol kinase
LFRFASFASFSFISFSLCIGACWFASKRYKRNKPPLFRFEAKRISLPFCLVSLQSKLSKDINLLST